MGYLSQSFLISGALINAGYNFVCFNKKNRFIACLLKGIYPEFQVIRGFSQKIPAGLLSYDQIHS